ncbi:uncharacterized protein LOC143735476 isoform X2 [Siphateles boraxobius]|uniref:uncharacterized protein LOC143735476 isoform X2 n=1 Tax=Siphateles boraxobius TaxID=180520 RepID=UPI0040645508
MRNLSLLFGAVLLVQGVFGVDEVNSVSVMVGDSLTLNSDFTETKGDELQWKIEGESNILAQIDREVNTFSVPGNNEERFRDRLKLDHHIGSLTITNIRTTDSGVYELKIKDSMNENKYRFIVTVRDEMKTVSVNEGDSVTLRTGVIDIQIYDLILWKFKDHVIAKIIKLTNQMSLYDTSDERFKGRLQLNEKTGSLSISKSRTTDSEDYSLHMNGSTHTVQRTISVTVNSRSGAVSGISGASVVLMIWAITVFLLQEV